MFTNLLNKEFYSDNDWSSNANDLVERLNDLMHQEKRIFQRILNTLYNQDESLRNKLENCSELEQKLIQNEQNCYDTMQNILKIDSGISYSVKETKLKDILQLFFERKDHSERILHWVREQEERHFKEINEGNHLKHLLDLLKQLVDKNREHHNKLVAIERNWNDKVSGETIILEITQKFDKEQSASFKFPIDSELNIWQKGKPITSSELHIDEPNIRVMEKVTMTYVLDDLDFDNRLINIKAKIKVNHNQIEGEFNLKVKGLASETEIDSFYVDHLLDLHRDRELKPKPEVLIFDFSLEPIKANQIGITSIQPLHDVQLVYEIIHIDYLNNKMEVLVTAAKKDIKRSKRFNITGFVDYSNFWISTESEIKRVAQNVDVNEQYSNNNTWLDLLNVVKETLVSKDYLKPGLINFIKWESVEHRPLDTKLKDDFIFDTNASKKIKFFLFKDQSQYKEYESEFYFKNIKKSHGENVTREMIVSDQINADKLFKVGATDDQETKEYEKVVIWKNFGSEFETWKNFQGQYLQMKFKSLALHYTMQGPNRSSINLDNKVFNLSEVKLDEPKELYSFVHDLYTYKHILRFSFRLAIDDSGDLGIHFILFGQNENQVEPIHAYFTDSKLEFISK